MRYMNALKHASARTLSRLGLLELVRRRRLSKPPAEFTNSEDYWKQRYEKGGNSGEGSYGPLAQYKASFINQFCKDHGVGSVVEFGCGDGNQASKLKVERYTGVDISEQCIEWARRNIRRDGWQFLTLDEFRSLDENDFEAALSLDVVYHLIEDEVYERYLSDLFGSASRFVLIYSSNLDFFDPKFPHVRHRPIVSDVARLEPGWQFVRTEPNPYYREPTSSEYGSFAQFHIFQKPV